MRTVVALAVILGMACGEDHASGPSFPTDHPRILLPTQRDRLAKALTAATPAAQRFRDIVDRWIGGEDIYAFPIWYAALLGQLTGDAKYCTHAVAAIDAQVMSAQAAIAAGNAPDVAGDDYLAVGDSIGDLALVYDWCHDAVGSRGDAWLAYANQAVQNVWHPDAATWGGKPMAWTGWAIDDPADNYYYSFLRATMLLGLATHGDDADGQQWISEFRDTKLAGELVPMFDAELVGGGSREGTGYGVAMRGLFELYALWQASTSEDVATLTPHTRASMLAFIHSTLPTLDRVAPTGDQSRDSTASFFDYHRDYLEELVALFPDDPLAPRIEALLAASSVPEMSQPFMVGYDFVNDHGIAPTTLDGLGRAYYAPGTGQLYARSGWDAHATWVNLIAGPYTESHAHEDQGAIMLYKDGWLGYDAVVDSHSGLRNEVSAHSTMRIGTLEQQSGTESKLVALHRGDGYVYAAADLAPAYAGQVAMLQRELVYLEPDVVVVYDRVTSNDAQVWQLATPAMPMLAAGGASLSAAGHTLTITRVTPASADSGVVAYASDSDFSGGYRLEENQPAGDHRWLHVLAIDGAGGAPNAIDDHTVELVVGGHTMRVSFTPSGPGATLVIDGATTTLAPGVDTLPE